MAADVARQQTMLIQNFGFKPEDIRVSETKKGKQDIKLFWPATSGFRFRLLFLTRGDDVCRC
jgi:hypothetical protein